MNHNKLKEGYIVAYIKKYEDLRGLIRVRPIVCMVVNVTKEDIDNKKFFKPGLHLMRSWSYYRKETTYSHKKHYAVCEGHVNDFKNVPFTLLFESGDSLTARQIAELLL